MLQKQSKIDDWSDRTESAYILCVLRDTTHIDLPHKLFSVWTASFPSLIDSGNSSLEQLMPQVFKPF